MKKNTLIFMTMILLSVTFVNAGMSTFYNNILNVDNTLNVNNLNANVTLIATADTSGGCTNRPFTSTEAKTISIYGTDSIQEAICDNLPYFLRHRLTINVYSNYSLRENVTIPPYVGEQSTDYNGGQLRLRANAGEYPKINGIFASGIMGQAQPYFEGLNITGYHPYYTGECQICLFGVQTSEMYNMRFSGNSTVNVYGVTSYGGNVKVSDCVFENGTQYAIETKQGGKALVMNITGTVTNTPFYASTGEIIIDYRGYSSITGGVQRYKRLAGYIVEQEKSDYTMQKLYGVDAIDTLEHVGALKTNFTINSTNTKVTNLLASDVNVSDDLTVDDDAQIRQLFVNCQGSTCTRDVEINSSAGGFRLRSEANDTWGTSITLTKRGNNSGYGNIPSSGATLGYYKTGAWDGTSLRDLTEITGWLTGTLNSTSRPSKLTFSTIPLGSTTIRQELQIDEKGLTIGNGVIQQGITMTDELGSEHCIRVNSTNSMVSVNGAC